MVKAEVKFMNCSFSAVTTQSTVPTQQPTTESPTVAKPSNKHYIMGAVGGGAAALIIAIIIITTICVFMRRLVYYFLRKILLSDILARYSDLPVPPTLRQRGICMSRYFSRAMSLSESSDWGSLDGKVILEIKSKFSPFVQTFVETIKTSQQYHRIWKFPPII